MSEIEITQSVFGAVLGGLVGAALFMFGYYTGRAIGRDQGWSDCMKSLIGKMRHRAELEAEVRRQLAAEHDPDGVEPTRHPPH